MKVKLRFVQQEPLLYRFFYKVFLEIPDELQDEMAVTVCRLQLPPARAWQRKRFDSVKAERGC